MSFSMFHSLQEESSETTTGELTFAITSTIGLIPINNATITITVSNNPSQPIATLQTDESGRTALTQLTTPSFSLSQAPSEEQPYANYNVEVSAPGYKTEFISDVEVLPEVTALLEVSLEPDTEQEPVFPIVIPPHTLFGDYPPKIPEAEVKPVDESGEIVLSRVVIPEYIVVHDGPPSDSSARDYYVFYKDYIKNVVSSEIYATWPESTIIANTLAIQSFTLNRVYTEWYRNRGYHFTVTSDTAYDQKWIYGRNIYENIDRIVDNIFSNYLSRPGVRQPIFTSYCDGNRATCSGMSQWGSKYLGDQGYSAIEILRYYYGNDLYINSSSFISGIPVSYPGYDLTIGSSGDKVLQLQRQLNRIADNYPAIPKISEDGIYGPDTANAVKTFQGIFNLPQTGITDFPTWYKISNVYVGVTRIAEPGT